MQAEKKKGKQAEKITYDLDSSVEEEFSYASSHGAEFEEEEKLNQVIQQYMVPQEPLFQEEVLERTNKMEAKKVVAEVGKLECPTIREKDAPSQFLVLKNDENKSNKETPTEPNKKKDARRVITPGDILKERKSRNLPISFQQKCYGCNSSYADDDDLSNCFFTHAEDLLVPLGETVYEEEIEEGKKKNEALKSARYNLYCQYNRYYHGFFGMGVQHPIPTCVEACIKNKFPDPKGQFAFIRLAKSTKK